MDLSDSEDGKIAECCEHGDEHSGSIKCREFLNKLKNYRVILSVLDPRKCEYLKDYSLDFEHAYMTTYLAS